MIKKKKYDKDLKKTAHFQSKIIKCLGLGFEITGMVIAGLFLGKVIGKSIEYEGLGAMLGSLLGFFVWVLRILFLTKSYNSK